ncbi:uncharacterized protein ACLA_058170 [Aspergillus clavatus NRRL 1]|uniref:BTB domain-containing protein n=1 Tax=Aspergillus clavatus (strain ATCC 1007 / CBS 513.65 / DSM 816 / NCTC 3887 / NRRL 1 / QM 1276 / 107) TaxID=344612 RepID=A1C420_ASPCL|nr:uncharacterized protein ACLA_058170 [Aspergillus clavatus NRRL 1]EAW15160.1 hypothetical protein ACLA_058170 [Aspergillus clavatus NRRL 1]
MSSTVFPGNSVDPDPNGDVTLLVSLPQVSALFGASHEMTVKYRASSKHLSLASRYFEKRLKAEWAEGKALQSDGHVEMKIPETDPQVFLILLNLMHCRTKRVPTTVTFDELTKLAILVDYYQCHEILGLYPQHWLQPWRGQTPTTYRDEIVKWIFSGRIPF